jgi:DNA invertase Pin-like site-specific DNA recombinase
VRLKKLTDMGVNWRSYTEQYLDSLGPFRDAVLAILASIARQEHIRMGERVRAGIERRKREGVRWGHWRRKAVDMGLLKQMREDRYSIREIAKVMRVSPTTIVERLKELTDEAQAQ